MLYPSIARDLQRAFRSSQRHAAIQVGTQRPAEYSPERPSPASVVVLKCATGYPLQQYIIQDYLSALVIKLAPEMKQQVLKTTTTG
jgi:hypothetical protein